MCKTYLFLGGWTDRSRDKKVMKLEQSAQDCWHLVNEDQEDKYHQTANIIGYLFLWLISESLISGLIP